MAFGSYRRDQTDAVPGSCPRDDPNMRFMIKESGGVNADVFIEFLRRLLIGAKRKIFLIVDRGPAQGLC